MHEKVQWSDLQENISIFFAFQTLYVYQNSKLLDPVVWFELIYELLGQSNMSTQFLPITRKKLNVPKSNLKYDQ